MPRELSRSVRATCMAAIEMNELRMFSKLLSVERVSTSIRSTPSGFRTSAQR